MIWFLTISAVTFLSKYLAAVVKWMGVIDQKLLFEKVEALGDNEISHLRSPNMMPSLMLTKKVGRAR